MKVSKAISLYREYQLATHKTGTIRGYNYVLNLLEKLYANKNVETLTTSDISSFLEFLTNDRNQCKCKIPSNRIIACLVDRQVIVLCDGSPREII